MAEPSSRPHRGATQDRRHETLAKSQPGPTAAARRHGVILIALALDGAVALVGELLGDAGSIAISRRRYGSCCP